MPERKFKGFRIDCSEVQGEGAYAHLLRPSWEQIRIAQANDEATDNVGAMIQVITALLDDWNWVDDEGNQLPLPIDDKDVVSNLPWQEQNFLINKLGELANKDEKN